MEYELTFRMDQALEARVASTLDEADPSAVVDYDAARDLLRLATLLPHADVLAMLQGAGLRAGVDDLRQLPSVCCGGCSFG